jgi:hypothetical protein
LNFRQDTERQAPPIRIEKVMEFCITKVISYSEF